ncbi:MAG: glycosyltransferase family 39 protein [Actinobacteria bacterium]|nr:glycosyltransferase family 39 protein [Actinomycetota bacterium]
MSQTETKQRIRSVLPAFLTIVGVPLALFLIYGRPYLNYDASYSLVWANDIAHGLTPDYTGYIAPTPHPLQTFVSFLALPFGSLTEDLLAWTVMLAFGALAWIVYRLGRELFNSPVGVLAALVVVSRPALAKNVEAAYQDVPFVLFVCWALLLEVRSPRRGWPVLVMLTLAGLLRPEAWVLAGLYWLYLFPAREWRERIPLALLAAAGPVLWALSDWAVTGDLLHSFHGTKDLAAQLDRPRRPSQAPFWTLKFLGWTLREPLIVGVPIGAVFMLLFARRQAKILFGLAGLMTLIFIASTLGGLPLIARYVLTPAVLLSIVYAAGVLGWRDLPDGSRERSLWKWIGAASLALSIVFIPWHLDLTREQMRKVDNYGSIQRDLRGVAHAPTVREFYLRCGRISTNNHRPVPAFRYELDGPPGSVQTLKDDAHPLAETILYPRNRSIAVKYYNEVPSLTPPDGYETVFTSWAWRLYASPRCRAAVEAGRTLPGVDRD